MRDAPRTPETPSEDVERGAGPGQPEDVERERGEAGSDQAGAVSPELGAPGR